MKEILLFIFILILYLYFEKNHPNGLGQYSLYLILGMLIVITLRALRYSA